MNDLPNAISTSSQSIYLQSYRSSTQKPSRVFDRFIDCLHESYGIRAPVADHFVEKDAVHGNTGLMRRPPGVSCDVFGNIRYVSRSVASGNISHCLYIVERIQFLNRRVKVIVGRC